MLGLSRVFFQWSGIVTCLGVAMASCNRNTPAVDIPARPVASPTSAQSAGASRPAEQGPRAEAEPDVPFDGGRPERLVIPPTTIPQESLQTKKNFDIYSELLGQALTCEGSQP
jgi:hypothetical protein